MPVKTFRKIITMGKSVLVVFDLDDTLTPFQYPISARIIQFLKRLEARQNLRLAVNSMQSCEFLSGMWRQAGFNPDRWYLIGENGAMTWYRAQMPCEKFVDPIIADDLPLQQQRLANIYQINKLLEGRADCYDVPYGSTGFVPRDRSQTSSKDLWEILQAAEFHLAAPFKLQVHDFCLQLHIGEMSKVRALSFLRKQFHFDKMIVFGDSVEYDLPMLELADLGFWFGEPNTFLLAHMYAYPSLDDFVDDLEI